MYRDDKTFDERANIARRVLEKYPDRVPIIVERSPNSKLPEIDHKKWLAPSTLTVGQWLMVLRRRICLSQTEGLFVLVNGIMPTVSSTLRDIYDRHKDADGLLYWVYTEMNTFG